IGMGLYVYYKSHSGAAHGGADIVTDAESLYREFQQDETAANKKFLDKIIEVKGVVADGQRSPNMSSLQLNAGEGPGRINCSLSNSATHLQIPAMGTAITVKGKYAGFLMDVNLVDCVVYP
ncbi:MAG TPA: hypothetical protein VK543_10130, partial [Puia sp.]|nr:hypothetical protein [Puia sp.]